jgi:alginate O-acetyltransferase complex protein AlgI
MLFCSQQFLVFFAVVFTAYWALPWATWRVYLLLAASFYFYASWSQWLAGIICVSTLVDYAVARGMEATAAPRWRRALLGVSLVGNLGLLAYFKYANFFLDSLTQALHAVGASASLPVLQVILPIGISFYTFEAINYTVDVYRRRIPAERNLAHFMLFILFFPHLVAGPIVRARDFLPQVRRPKQWDWLRVQLGLQFVLTGMFKKMVVADRMALFVDPIYAAPGMYSTGALWLAFFAYALQIYCDFSGYTDLAIGAAHLLGYKLAKNFDMPYLAVNIADFWRRWHISLSSWLRDYLFIPLGGSRGTRRQTYRNLLITMTLGGLWHGAGWTFVVWGVLHGLLLIWHRAFRDWCERRPTWSRLLASAPGTVLRIATTFFCVSALWVVFRATRPTDAWEILRHLFRPHTGAVDAPIAYHSLVVLAAVLALGYWLALPRIRRYLAMRLPEPIWGLGYAAAVTLILLLTPESNKVFIYFQF